MKTALALVTVVASLATAGVASARPFHHHHPMKVCGFHHHHRVCRYR